MWKRAEHSLLGPMHLGIAAGIPWDERTIRCAGAPGNAKVLLGLRMRCQRPAIHGSFVGCPFAMPTRPRPSPRLRRAGCRRAREWIAPVGVYVPRQGHRKLLPCHRPTSRYIFTSYSPSGETGPSAAPSGQNQLVTRFRWLAPPANFRNSFGIGNRAEESNP
jgi:hypothetical protein